MIRPIKGKSNQDHSYENRKMDGHNTSSYYYLPLKILLAWTLAYAMMAEQVLALLEEAWIIINGASNTKGRVSCQVLMDLRRILSEMLSTHETSAIDRMVNSMSLPYFYLRKLVPGLSH
jgi:hypothetical protein